MKYIDFEREYFFSRLIWLFPIALLFHVIEESNGFAYWVTNVLKGEMQIGAFYANNIMGMFISIILCLMVSSTRISGTTFVLFLWVSAVHFWNFVFHMYAQYRFHTYSPGYFTAVLLYFPIYSYLSYLSLRERFLPWYLWLIAFVAGCFLMGFIIWAGLYHLGPIPWEMWFF
jgi:hypothetical protein